MSSVSRSQYFRFLKEVKEKIGVARSHAALAVNRHLLTLYWEIGSMILREQDQKGWGAKIIDKLASDLHDAFPEMKGFSVRNLKYMRAFAREYPEFVQAPLAQIGDGNTIVQAPLAQLPWYHHIALLDRVKDRNARLFYITKAVEFGWSRNVMIHQIESGLHNRQGKAITNFDRTLPPLQSDLAKETLKNPYIFDFLSLGENIQEKDFEKALVERIRKFLLELGRGFAYVGSQVQLTIGPHEYYIDLLFYNYHLHCFVIFELKIGDFKPEYAGKLNFYIQLVNEKLKMPEHKPTIGVLLCKTQDETVVKYSLSGIGTPMGVSEYKLATALPRTLKGGMPTISEIEEELAKEQERMEGEIEHLHRKKAKRKLLPAATNTSRKNKDSPAKKSPLVDNVFLPLIMALEAGVKRAMPGRAGVPELTIRTAKGRWKNAAHFQKHMKNNANSAQTLVLDVKVKMRGKKISDPVCRLMVKAHLSGFTAGMEGDKKPLISSKQVRSLSRIESDRIVKEAVKHLRQRLRMLGKKTRN